MKKIILIFAVLLYGLQANAQWKSVKNLQIDFKIKNAGIGVDGTFKTAKAIVYLDESNLSKSSFVGIVEVASISTGIKLRDTHLKEKEEYFQADKFPTINMKSVSIALKSAGVYAVVWELTMRGVTRKFTSDVTTVVKDNNLVLSTQVKLNRLDWKVGGKSFTMNDYVTLKLSASVLK
jgi:polyisoprenoid-binding protein YceI